MEPKYLKYALITIALLYLIFPKDLIPDMFGRGLGLIDDVSLMAALAYFYRRKIREFAARATAGQFAQAGGDAEQPKAQQSTRAFDPHQVLGIPASSSQEAIRSAYRSRMAEYHPDKVAHLGKELQDLAHKKVLEIQQAYQHLKK